MLVGMFFPVVVLQSMLSIQELHSWNISCEVSEKSHLTKVFQNISSQQSNNLMITEDELIQSIKILCLPFLRKTIIFIHSFFKLKSNSIQHFSQVFYL
jgi:hypothetical protein